LARNKHCSGIASASNIRYDSRYFDLWLVYLLYVIREDEYTNVKNYGNILRVWTVDPPDDKFGDMIGVS
jgi:hypothetical protein